MCPFFHIYFLVDHLPDKEPRKRKPKKTFELDFNADVNLDTYFRTTRVNGSALSKLEIPLKYDSLDITGFER